MHTNCFRLLYIHEITMKDMGNNFHENLHLIINQQKNHLC